MSSFLSFFTSIFVNLFGMFTDSSIASLFGGLSLHWILLGFFILWSICQTFVFRGNISPGLTPFNPNEGRVYTRSDETRLTVSSNGYWTSDEYEDKTGG